MGCLVSVSFCTHRKTFTRREVGEPSLFQFLFICHHLATQITGVIVLWVEQTLNGVESFNLISETKLDDSIQCLKNEFMLGFLNARATGAPTVVKIMDRNSWKMLKDFSTQQEQLMLASGLPATYYQGPMLLNFSYLSCWTWLADASLNQVPLSKLVHSTLTQAN